MTKWNKKSIRIGVWFSILICLALSSVAQHHTAVDSVQIDVADSLKSIKSKNKVLEFITKRRNFLIAPQFDRAPETGILSGIYYLQLFKNKKDSATRTSNTETFASFTQKSQYLAEFNETILFRKEKYILRGTSMFTRYNEYFYGIGNGISLNQKDRIEFNLFQTTQRFTRVITKKFFVGIQYQYYQTYNISSQDGGLLKAYAAEGTAVGANGSQTSGVGPVFLFDTRDNVIYSRTGSYVDVSALFVRDIFGGNHEFTNFTLDARKFFKFYKNDVICFQGLINYNMGDVPFKQLALMGSDVMMRGYYMGGYRDKIMMCTQTEMRIPVWRFIGLILFAAAGEVQSDINFFNWDDLKITYGFGLRFMFIKHERVNIGGDLGFGTGTKALYFGSGESF